MKIPISPHLHQPLILSVFLTIAILGGIKRYLILVLICISLTANDVEHLFMCLLTGLLYIFLEGMFIQILCPFYFLGYQM